MKSKTLLEKAKEAVTLDQRVIIKTRATSERADLVIAFFHGTVSTSQVHRALELEGTLSQTRSVMVSDLRECLANGLIKMVRT